MGLHTIYTLQLTYGNAFCFAGAPTFFRGLPHGFSFYIRFSARVQALLLGPVLSTQHCTTQLHTICHSSAHKQHAYRSTVMHVISQGRQSSNQYSTRSSTQHSSATRIIPTILIRSTIDNIYESKITMTMKYTHTMTSKELQTAHQNATTVSDWLELGYTKAYAKALVAMQQRVDAKKAFYSVWDKA